jgi:hypothetical protein
MSNAPRLKRAIELRSAALSNNFMQRSPADKAECNTLVEAVKLMNLGVEPYTAVQQANVDVTKLRFA